MLNHKCTTISINASDTTEYLGAKTNLASTILQSAKKVKVFDSLIFWGSLYFVNQKKNLAKSENTMPNFKCTPFRMHQIPLGVVTKINLALIILQSTKKKLKTFSFLIILGTPLHC